jgi:hypothetical protein
MAKKADDAFTDKMLAKAKKATEKTHKHASQLELELVQFKTGDKNVEFAIDLTGETVWATQQQIADAFDVARNTVTEHLQNIFKDNELKEATCCRKIRQHLPDGREYEVQHYNLDAILSVGYRVSSSKATRFRQWATQTLRSYVVDGYAINEARLREDRAAAGRLAAKLRAIRADEKSIYASVREYFKLASTDYDPSSQKCKTFYATLQDKFHFAITSKTASQLILERADHKKPAMGITIFDGNIPDVDEAKVGKNYLESDELYALHLLSEQFLLYIESKALRNQKMTMAELASKLDDLLKFNEYPVFKGYKDFLKDKAVRHAMAEYAMFAVRLKKEDVQALIAKKKK